MPLSGCRYSVDRVVVWVNSKIIAGQKQSKDRSFACPSSVLCSPCFARWEKVWPEVFWLSAPLHLLLGFCYLRVNNSWDIVLALWIWFADLFYQRLCTQEIRLQNFEALLVRSKFVRLRPVGVVAAMVSMWVLSHVARQAAKYFCLLL